MMQKNLSPSQKAELDAAIRVIGHVTKQARKAKAAPPPQVMAELVAARATVKRINNQRSDNTKKSSESKEASI